MNNKRHITTSCITTRSQIIKNNEETIRKYEIQMREHENERLNYEREIQNLKKKLIEIEKLNDLMSNEQEQNSQEFEMLCKENCELKRKLAAEKERNAELNNDMINVTIANQTLIDNQEEINDIQNSFITPMKNEMRSIVKENEDLHLKYNKLLQEHINSVQTKVCKCMSHNTFRIYKRKHYEKINKMKQQKKFVKKNQQIYKLKSKSTHLQKEYSKLVLDYEEKLKAYDLEKIILEKKVDELELLCKKYQTTLDNDTENGVSVYKHNKTARKLNVDNDAPVVKDNDMTLYNDIENANKTNKNNYKYEVQIVGDKFAKYMGCMLKDALPNDYDVCCYTYLDSSVSVILDKAESILKQHIDRPFTLVLLIKSVKDRISKKYLVIMSKLLNLAQEKGVNLIYSNIPYYKNNNNNDQHETYHINSCIYNINIKLQSMSFSTQSTQVIDINLKPFINTKESYQKKLVCSVIKQACQNQEKKLMEHMELINSEGNKEINVNTQQVFPIGFVQVLQKKQTL